MLVLGGIAGFKRSAYDDYVQRLLKTILHTKTLYGDVTARLKAAGRSVSELFTTFLQA
jgi:hypothetical protein